MRKSEQPAECIHVHFVRIPGSFSYSTNTSTDSAAVVFSAWVSGSSKQTKVTDNDSIAISSTSQSHHAFCFFQHIWCMTPCLRTWKINCAFVRTCCTIGLAATIGPCAEICGLYFSKVRVRYQRMPDAPGEDKDIMTV